LARQFPSAAIKLLGPVLGILAKPPIPGQVKTRLVPPLTHREAAELYRVSLTETVARMDRGRFALVLFHAGPAEFFRATFPDLPLRPQGEGDLGQRMAAALDVLLARGHTAAALIGSDSPDLPAAQVEDAFAALEQAEVVTVPATDGGYVLIGVRRRRPELFRDMPWSTAKVLAATRRRAADLAIAYRELGGWADVDDIDDLRRLLARSPDSATARFTLTHLAHRL